MAGKAMRALKNRVQARFAELVAADLLSVDSAGDFVISDTQYSDYSGSDLSRANLLTLSRDYPDVVTEYAGGIHGDAYGWIDRAVLNDGPPAGTPDIAERVMYVLDLVEGLQDYPLLSDEDLSEVQAVIMRESWDGYYAGEFRKAVESVRQAACVACQRWEASEYGSGVPMCPDLADHDAYDDGTAYEMFATTDEWPTYRATEMEWHGDVDTLADEYVKRERDAAAEAEDALHSGGLFAL
jgi:hypothetical protein